MNISKKTKAVLIRGGKGLASVVTSYTIQWVSSPAVLGVVPHAEAPLITIILVPALLALEKLINFSPDATPPTQ